MLSVWRERGPRGEREGRGWAGSDVCKGAVCGIEIVPELAGGAAAVLGRLGYDVRTRVGDGWAGWPEEAPFEGVIVTAAPETVPEALVEQLASGGLPLIPISEPTRPD